MRTRLIGLTIALALLSAGCDVFSTTSSPLASGVPASAGPSGTAAAASSSTAALPSATPSPAISLGPEECIPETPSALAANWATLQARDGDFAFKFPTDWEHLYGAFLFQTSSLLDPVSIAETGIPADATTKADLVRNPTTGLPNASVLIVPGITSNAQTIYQREEARFRAIAGVQIRRTDLIACLGGMKAYGLEFTFGNDQTLQQSWYVVKNGRVYDFQWLAPRADPRLVIFLEMFRSWAWAENFPVATPRPTPRATPTPSGGASGSPAASGSAGASAAPSASAAFVLGGMAASITEGATAADPKTFTKKLDKDLKSIYAVFALQPGLTGRVEGELRKNGSLLAALVLDYSATHTWGDFRINSETGFAAGTDYEFTIRHVPSDARLVLTFAVE